MRTVRRTFAALALPCALLCTLGGAAAAQADITITSPVADGYTNNRSPVVAFTGAAAGAAVTLEVDGSDGSNSGSGTANGSGNGTVTTDAPITVAPIDTDPDTGEPLGHRYGLTVRDTTGGTQNSVTAHIDQTPSLTGTIDGTHAAADVVFHADSAIPDHAVKLYIDGVLDQTVTADDEGNYYDDIVPTASRLTPGPHTAYLKSMDQGDLLSSPGNTASFNVAPPAPLFSQLFDNVQLNQAQPVVTFHAVNTAASEVTLYELDGDGDPVSLGDTTQINSDGTATITPSALSDGYHYLYATQTVSGIETVDDEGDNGPVSVFVNTSAPVVQTSFDGPVTSDNTPYFLEDNILENGLDNHTYTKLYIDGRLAGSSDPASNVGSIQGDDPIADGTHSAYTVTVDDLGHESATQSNTVDFTVDTVGPAAPTVLSPANGSTIGVSTPSVTVKTEPGTVTYLQVDPDGEGITQTADADGNVTFALTHALTDGVHTLYVGSQDAAGNYGDEATSTFTVRTSKPPVTAPPAPVTPAPVVAAPPTAKQVLTAVIASVAKFSTALEQLDPAALATAKSTAVPFVFSEPGTAKIQITAAAPPNGHSASASKAKTVVVASGTKTVTTAGSAKVTLKVTSAGKKLLRHAKSVKLTVKATFTPKRTGKAQASTKVVKLKH
jgi:hypothetical protein